MRLSILIAVLLLFGGVLYSSAVSFHAGISARAGFFSLYASAEG